ncbi:hypothetical protein CCU68_15460 [Pseudomonas gingeri NCPPB 3146 = LMG 5327]|uniref:DUF1534 domain-containing protein n=1 Tax=Pseudomonas gingeri NCPPB 3146 = LMG 5327 TaxID=707248 RepID=A0ABX4Y310_9PSED|nr:hypothetical protein CCU68_15460 [Pseudomonas gingeri NCPPB 3146 = LMG 5327]
MVAAAGLKQRPFTDRSHAPRGNAARDAPRHRFAADAERPGRHSHAERGNDQPSDRNRRQAGSHKGARLKACVYAARC